MGLGQVLFKATGIMTKRVRLNKCAELGEFLTQRTMQAGKTSLEDVSFFLEQNLSPAKMKRIKVAGDKNILRDFLSKEMEIPEEYAKFLAEYATLSSVAKSPVTGNALLDLRIADMKPSQAINTCVHETQHLLKRTSAIDTRLSELYLKIRGGKYTQKLMQRYSEILNKKAVSTQQMLMGEVLNYNHGTEGFANGEALDIILSKTGCKDIKQLREYLREMIRKEIVIPGCDKRNYKVLNGIRSVLKDEANSYKIGGIAEKNYCNASGIAFNGDTKAETVSRLYSETAKVLRGESRRQWVNNIKRFFGLKPKEYAIVPSSKMDIVSKEDFKVLLEEGIITKEEFEAMF